MLINQPKETLSFKISLNGTFWDKLPEYSIWLNDEFISSGTANEELQFIEFTHSIAEGTQNKLIIKLLNKEDGDTVESEDKSNIIKDMLLNIDSISIDDIELGQLMWSLSKFIADDPNRPTLKNCVNLGWNGSYVLEFTSPFYLWLLENM